MKLKHVFAVVLAVVFAACEDGPKKKYNPQSIGAINSVAVVMSNSLWEGAVGDKVREHFAAPLIGLTWDEPTFDLVHLPPSVFQGTTQYRRAVLYVDLDSVTGAQIREDLYAAPQQVAVVKGDSDSALIQTLDTHAARIKQEFRRMELQESQQRFLRSLSKENVLDEKYGVNLRLPSVYKVGKQEDNFVWIDREIQKGSMNIIAYEMPADYFQSDSTLVRDIVRMRDSIGRLYVPGPDVPGKITYMGTEKAFAPAVFASEVNGFKAVEVRGIWEVVNYPMAGPFLTYIVNDTVRNRKMVLEGFTFAPATNKRDYMFELEAILRTLKIQGQE